MSRPWWDSVAGRRKLLYVGLIAALLYPLHVLSRPTVLTTTGRASEAPGVLAGLRQKYRLGQADLGKIDPASETVKLATFGLRGIAATLLWNQAEEYKNRKDWTHLSAAYQQIIYLQPNYIDVWRFQAWNYSYNISYEFDDYHDRYYWVVRGIDFLQEGLEYNADEPRLLSAIGHFASHKLGRSDERRQFRALFRDDDDFHARQRFQERDNFLYAREYFREAERVAEISTDEARVVKAAISPLVFFSQSTFATTNHATALEDDHAEALAAIVARKAQRSAANGVQAVDQTARLDEVDTTFAVRITAAWQAGAAAWQRYLDRQFFTADGRAYRLADLPRIEEQLAQLRAELEAFDPGLRQRIEGEKRVALPEALRRALDRLPFERTDDDQQLAAEAEHKIAVSHAEVGRRVVGANAASARALAAKLDDLENYRNQIVADKEPNHVDYWVGRCQLEQTAPARAARRQIHRGTVAYREADLPHAARELDAGFRAWRAVLDAHPEFLDDPTGVVMYDAIHDYELTLRQLDQPFPAKFVLDDLRRSFDRMMGSASSTP